MFDQLNDVDLINAENDFGGIDKKICLRQKITFQPIIEDIK